MRAAFVFDENKCTGCQACVLACTIENELPPAVSWRGVHTANPERRPELPVFHLSLACNHCEHPACMEACPAAAYAKDGSTGAVLIDSAKCIGCRYCSWACPYDAPRFDHDAGIMTKCTFCAPRLRDGRKPACAISCPTGALDVEALAAEAMTHDVPGFPRTGLGPAIRIVPLRPGSAAPVMDPASAPAVTIPPASTARRIAFQSEWSLAAFTFLVAALVAAFTAHRMSGFPLPGPAFAAVAGLAMALSAAHLGRKERAWRAVLNLRTSWLSREVASVSAFAALGLFNLALRPADAITGWAGIAVGAFALFSIDRVYDVAELAPRARPHSAGALLTGAFLAAVMLMNPWVAGILGAVKLALVMRRVGGRTGEAGRRTPRRTAWRLGLGFAGPAGLWIADGREASWVILAFVLLAEFLDRADFYDDLDIVSPRREMARLGS